MGVNSLLKTVTRQRRDCNLNPGPSAPESSTLTIQLTVTHGYLPMCVLPLPPIDTHFLSHCRGLEAQLALVSRALHRCYNQRLTLTHPRTGCAQRRVEV